MAANVEKLTLERIHAILKPHGPDMGLRIEAIGESGLFLLVSAPGGPAKRVLISATEMD